MAGRKHDKPFICMDIDLPRHQRLMACEDPMACLGMWAAMAAYSREFLTNAKVPKRIAMGMGNGRKNAKHLEDMVRVGLLEDLGTEYLVLRYAPRNQTKEMVEEAKAKAKARMARVRANNPRTNGEQSGDVLTSTSFSDLRERVQGEGEPENPAQPTPITNATGDGVGGFAVSAWAEGIRSVTKAPFVEPPRGGTEVRKLVNAIVTFCPDPANREDWARQAGAKFAREHTRGTLSVHSFVDSLNSPANRSTDPGADSPSRKRLAPISRPKEAGNG